MSGAIVVTRAGGPEVLEWTDRDPGLPGPGEVLIRHTYVGLNFIDVYHRTGLYPAELPFTPGVEGVGVVERIGEGVDDLSVGARVAYTSNGPIGSYCQERVLPRGRLVSLPDAISDEVAAAIMVKGCTVEYLVRRTYAVKPGDNVLLTAAAGGVGLIACQWLRALGANVIGTVGTEEKGELARANGCDHVILYRHEDVAARVAEITDGAGCAVVYDSVGADTFEGSIASLARRGTMVTFGNASGPVAPMSPLLLAKHGSLYLTRPRVGDYYATPEETRDGVEALFAMITSGKVRPHIGARYLMREAETAHRDLEARMTVGSSILVA
ncbi:MAG: quinone oxidoreductase [Gemmatimonadetes bacterium]|nr:quinone oxidoreductase [Gemmatimonadota bacterium]MDA1104826.1 quinone oxidoreductase [Gemmatimonadota bacterium]